MKLNLKFLVCLIVFGIGFLSSTDAQVSSYSVSTASIQDYYYDGYDYYGCYGDYYYYDSFASGPYGASGVAPSQ